MKKVWFFFDYGSDPVWYQDEHLVTRTNGMPPELENDKKLIKFMDELYEEYSLLFINNSYEFTYVGFKDEKSWKKFIKKVNKFIKLLKKSVEPEYELHLEQWERSKLSKNWITE